MVPRRWILFLTATLIAVLTACNSGSTNNVQNPPPPPPAGVTIAFQSTPPGSLAINSSTTVTAVVTNDSSNAGVDWVLTCQAGGTACGTLTPPHTASGSAATYTPPPSLTGNTEIINIEGFATADQTKNVLASINITAYGNNLSGTYVFAAQGLENSTIYQIAGAIVLDGNGNITSGQQTVDFSDQSTGGVTSVTLPVSASGSSYYLGPDGRGTITITPDNSNNPGTPIGTESFSLVYLSSSRLLITEIPNNTLSVTASGTMQLQASSISALTGGYAFVVTGTDFNSGSQLGVGGILNIDNKANNPNNISGTGSTTDQNFAGTVTGGQSVTGTITNPVTPGVVTLALTFPTAPNGIAAMAFYGYIVDTNHVQLIESDNGGFGSVAGLALGQGSSTGTFSDASFAGTYVFDAFGEDLANFVPNAPPSTFASLATFTADGAGHFSNGYTDTVFEFLTNPITGLQGTQISATFAGNYSVSANGKVSSTFGSFANPYNGFRPVTYFYLGGDGTALVMINSDTLLNYPLLAAGSANPQSTTLTLSGNYGLNFTQTITGPTEADGTATMTAALPSLTGLADVDSNPPGQAFTGTVTSQTCSNVTAGCFSGSFVNSQGPAPPFVGTNVNNPNVAFTADFYLIDQNHGFFVENDIAQQQNAAQLSVGYFETATAPQAPAAAGRSANSIRRRP